MVKILVITSGVAYEELKSYMKRWSNFYEVIPDVFYDSLGIYIYYIKMDVGYCLDIDFLTDLKKFTKGKIAIVGNPGELP
jgi:hypothetical protein